MDLRINIGCGQSPIQGWNNVDNSISLRIAKIPLLPGILRKLGLLEDAQYKFIQFAREHHIEYGDATKGLALPDASVGVVYSSHMLEHLDRIEADRFLKEAFRLLRPGGVLRMSVPDLKKQVAQYNLAGDADAFIAGTVLCVARPRSLAQRMGMLLMGTRHHQWMYDGGSLCSLLQKHGFTKVQVVSPGQTRIADHQPLNLQERVLESVYVEAQKPGT